MLATYKFRHRYNKYGVITIVASFILFVMMSVLPNVVFASNTAENFFDYVREERRREISGETEQRQTSYNNLDENTQRNLRYGRASTATLSIMWLIYIGFTWGKYTRPYCVQVEDVTAGHLCSMLPARASAIIGMSVFTKYDFIATVFDLIRRGFLFVSEHDDETKIYINSERYINEHHTIESYEDFLIRWFIFKIGDGEYFSFSRLWQFLSVNSRAAEFDIDYDIWNDELSEFAKTSQIIDDSIEKWKSCLCAIGIVYSFLGLFLLYVTQSTASILLFGITYLSYRLPLNIVRRTKEAEEDYIKLMRVSEMLDAAVQNENDIENCEKWDKYFTFSIVFRKTENVLNKYAKYGNIYHKMVEEFEKATIYSSDIISSPIR